MRLICGVVQLDGSAPDPTVLGAMVAALGYPGKTPSVSARTAGPAAIAVLDFASSSSNNQLPAAPDQTWIAADSRLNDCGLQSEETVALAACAKWGDDLPGHLDGDYALAFWNPATRRLMLARDIMGVRPLCYAHLPGKFIAFASVPRGLHGSRVIERKIDLDSIGFVQLRVTLQGDQTGWRGIHWLPPAHTLTATETGIRLHLGWRPDASIVGAWKGTAQAAAAEMRHHVDQAVSVRLSGSGPVATHLSGGLDSSGIAVLAARKLRQQGRKLHAYSILTDPTVPVMSEAPWVEAVLKQEPHIDWTPEYLPTDPPLPDNAADPDFLVDGDTASPDQHILHKAAASGCMLILSGAGGDEGVTYNARDPYAELVRQGKLRHAFQEVRARALVDDCALWRSIYRRLVLPLLPEFVRRVNNRRAGFPVRGDLESRSARFLNRSFARHILAQLPERSAVGSSPEERLQKLTQGLDSRANQWSSVGARYGIAVSYPLADRRIVEFCLSLPLERILDSGYSRQPYRNAMRGVLPEMVRLRTDKRGNAGVTAAAKAAAYAAFLPKIELLRNQPDLRSVFDFEAIEAALRFAVRNASKKDLPIDFSSYVPEWIFAAAHAARALILAEHLMRWQ